MNLPKSVLVKHQNKTYKGKTKEGNKVIATVRYDDSCNNKHNSFSITGEEYRNGRTLVSCGCIHEEIVEAIPELAPYLKWHLCSSDGPMHYIANTLFHAKDRTHIGYEIGQPVEFKKYLKFKSMPFTFPEPKGGFWEWLDTIKNPSNLEAERVPYIKEKPDDIDYSANYTLSGFSLAHPKQPWYSAPFKNVRTANEFLEALKTFPYSYVYVPTKWCEAVKPNLEAARESTIWEDATLEQLQDEEQLKARLPALMEEFKEAVESLGFTY